MIRNCQRGSDDVSCRDDRSMLKENTMRKVNVRSGVGGECQIHLSEGGVEAIQSPGDGELGVIQDTIESMEWLVHLLDSKMRGEGSPGLQKEGRRTSKTAGRGVIRVEAKFQSSPKREKLGASRTMSAFN